MQGAASPRVVLLNGPAGVGKTTIGRRLAAKWPKGVCIHGDELRRFIVTTVAGEVQGGLGYRNAATLAGNFLDAGYTAVVVEYVFEHPRHVRQFLEYAPQSVPIQLVTLWAPMSAVAEREATRTGRDRLGARVAQCYAAMEAVLTELGHVVTNLGDPDAVTSEVYAAVLEGRGLLASGDGGDPIPSQGCISSGGSE